MEFKPIVIFFEWLIVVSGDHDFNQTVSGLFTVTDQSDFTATRLIEEIKGILESQGWREECVKGGRLISIKRV
jgi:hypothetical protein